MEAKTSNSICAVFSQRMSQLLERDGKSRKDVCRDLDIKYTTFCDWINGRNIPKAPQIERLCDYFCVEPSYFFIETEPENAAERFANRVSGYAKKVRELSMESLSTMSDEQIRELLKSGFTFQHKTLEEYIRESGGELILSKKLDWGEPVGREVW